MSRPGSRSGSRPGSRGIMGSPMLPQWETFKRKTRTLATAPGSRSVSRSSSRGRRDSISDEYKRRSISADRIRTFDDMIAQAGGNPRPTKVRRWDGNYRTTTNWDCLKKDPELWFSNGDCLVHFYGEGQSRRGPSLRLCLADIEASNCRPLLEKTCSQPVPDTPPTPGKRTKGDYFNNPRPPMYELFIAAPPNLNRDDAMKYHITTRNFFAWMFEKPLVGAKLGEALAGLLQRMNEWRPDREENEDDFLAYIDEQGYTDFRNCPDHALAVLYWAETFEHSELWTDAFVHCAGMNDQLVTSQEFINISRTTKAMITRANLDMAVRIDKASVALASFCEDDDNINHQIKLSDPALKHLQRFRSFLHSFYVQRHGYWPPHIVQSSYGKIRPLPKHTFLTMYSDFRNLYAFLVDEEANPGFQTEMGQSLINVISTYDRRQKFDTLPYLLPRVPHIDFDPADLRKRQRSFSFFGQRKAKQGKRTAIADALMSATNISDMKVVSSAIVREYALFEREYTMRENERISAMEARMARWVLIYALLQTLISVTNAPEEVRDLEGADYPLCVQIAGTPPWKFSKPSTSTITATSTNFKSVSTTTLATPTNPQSVSTTTLASIDMTPIDLQTPVLPSPLRVNGVGLRRKSSPPKPYLYSSRSSALKPPKTPSTETLMPMSAGPPVTAPRTSISKTSRLPIPVLPSQMPTPSRIPRLVSRISKVTPTKPIEEPLLSLSTQPSANSSASDLPPPATTPPPIRPRSLARTLTTKTTPVQCPRPQKPFVMNFSAPSERLPTMSSAFTNSPASNSVPDLHTRQSSHVSQPSWPEPLLQPQANAMPEAIPMPEPLYSTTSPDVHPTSMDFCGLPPQPPNRSPHRPSKSVASISTSSTSLALTTDLTAETSSIAGSAPTLISYHDSDPETPGGRSARTGSNVGGPTTPIPPPSPSIYTSSSLYGGSNPADWEYRPTTPGRGSKPGSASGLSSYAPLALRPEGKRQRDKAFSSQRASMRSTRSGKARESKMFPASSSEIGVGFGPVESYGLGERVGKNATHKRDRSAELAKAFREQIGWRKGPGWDKDVQAILMGQM